MAGILLLTGLPLELPLPLQLLLSRAFATSARPICPLGLMPGLAEIGAMLGRNLLPFLISHSAFFTVVLVPCARASQRLPHTRCTRFPAPRQHDAIGAAAAPAAAVMVAMAVAVAAALMMTAVTATVTAAAVTVTVAAVTVEAAPAAMTVVSVAAVSVAAVLVAAVSAVTVTRTKPYALLYSLRLRLEARPPCGEA